MAVLLHFLAWGTVAQPPVPGCFVDDVHNRQFPHQVCLVTGGCATLSREWCGQQCSASGFECTDSRTPSAPEGGGMRDHAGRAHRRTVLSLWSLA